MTGRMNGRLLFRLTLQMMLQRMLPIRAFLLLALLAACESRDAANDDNTTAGDALGGTPLTSVALPPLPVAPPHEAFAGAATCASCHREQFTAWRASTHGKAGGAPDEVRVIAPFDGTPIRFRDATVVPRQQNGVFSFVVQRAGDRDTALVVDAVIGGGHMEGGGTQGFVTKHADGTLRFLPFDWSRHNRTWFCNTATRSNHGWIPVTRMMRLADCGDWPPTRVLGDEPRFSNCQSCHGSQIDLSFDTAATSWVTRSNGFRINCESCHGPAARHVSLMRAGTATGTDIGIAALATLDKDASLNTCMSCHALKSRLAPSYRPGATLAQFYTLRLSQLGEQPLTADGRTRTFAYQEGHYASDCYRNGGMTCTSCHDPHTQGYRTVTGEAIPGRTDDRQCTSCHASKAIDVSAHTKHPATSTGSRCVSCHMPYQQQPELGRAIRYERSDHSIAIPRPSLDSSLGITSACRSCHAGVGDAQHTAQVQQWWGELKPHETAVAGVLAARGVSDIKTASALLVRPTSGNATAQVAGLAQWLESFGTADMASLPSSLDEALRTMTASSDIDVRALALATLHLTRGRDDATRRLLRDALQRVQVNSTDDAALRRRWVVVLGGLGDAARESGDAPRAVIAYRKALEVAPGDPALLLNLGLAFAAAGDAGAAVSAYQRSLAADARQPMAQVNLGIALERQGDVRAATEAYRRAISLDPTGPLGYLNHGTSLLREGNAAEAIPLFERALARDPGLAVGHYQLALARLKQGDLAGAESSVRRSLALDTTNSDAVRLADALREARAPR